MNRYYIDQALRDLRAGVTYSDRWPEGEEQELVEEEDENAPAPTRWWELEGLSFEEALKGGRS